MSPAREKTINWSEKLPRAIEVRDGKALRTRADVRSYILALPSDRVNRQGWVAAMNALVNGAKIEVVQYNVVNALQADGALAPITVPRKR